MYVRGLGVVGGEQSYAVPGTDGDLRFTASGVAEAMSFAMNFDCNELSARLDEFRGDIQDMVADYLANLIKDLAGGMRGIDVASIKDCAARIDSGGDFGVCDEAVASLVSEGSKVFGEGGFNVSGAIDVTISTFADVAITKIMNEVLDAMTKNIGLVSRIEDKLISLVCDSSTTPDVGSRNDPLQSQPVPSGSTQPPPRRPTMQIPSQLPTFSANVQVVSPAQIQQAISQMPRDKPTAPSPASRDKSRNLLPLAATVTGVGVASYLILRYRR